MITNQRMQEIVLGLLKQKSERDGQRKIGASDFSDPCSYHLAKKLLGVEQGESKYWLGAKIGTAMHLVLEDALTKADLEELPEVAGAIIEEKIFLGELDGYGVISSKPDCALVESNHLIDWKTSTRAKSKKMQQVIFGEKEHEDSIYTLNKYITQTQIYAWGLNNSGTPIDGISLVFMNRDGTSDSDVWTYTFEYDQAHAELAWSRLEAIWSGLQVEQNPEQFKRNDGCFQCKVTDPA